MSDGELKLKSCPFCGSEDVYIQTNPIPSYHRYIVSASIGKDIPLYASIYCSGCGFESKDIELPDYDTTEIGLKWNTRQRESDLLARLEVARQALEYSKNMAVKGMASHRVCIYGACDKALTALDLSKPLEG